MFKILEEKQYEHHKEFTTQLLIDEKVIGEGNGRTKKCAEQMAAQQALQYRNKIIKHLSLIFNFIGTYSTMVMGWNL